MQKEASHKLVCIIFEWPCLTVRLLYALELCGMALIQKLDPWIFWKEVGFSVTTLTCRSYFRVL